MKKSKKNSQIKILQFAKKKTLIATGIIVLLSFAGFMYRQSKLGADAVAQASPPCASVNDIPIGGVQLSSIHTAALADYQAAFDADGMDIFVSKIESGNKNGHLTVHVTDLFFEKSSKLRLLIAHLIAEAWANTYDGDNNGVTCVKILDSQGNRIGGQNVWGAVEIDGFDEKAYVTLMDDEGNSIGRYNAQGEFERIGN